MKKIVRMVKVSIGLVAIVAVGYWIFYLNGGFGPWYGNVFSLTSFDGEAKSVLEGCLRISPSSEIQFKHASLIGGKDWNLYVCFETPKTNWESILKSLSFPTRDGRDRHVRFETPALPWWKIEKADVDSILVATEGNTTIFVLNGDGVRRVFIETDGGRAGFPKGVWNLFKKQQ